MHTHLHDDAHDVPEVVWVFRRKQLMQLDGCLLLLLVAVNAHVAHEQCCQQVLVCTVLLQRVFIQLRNKIP